MPKVRFLSGEQAGRIKDLPVVEADQAVSSGFAELVRGESLPAPVERRGEVVRPPGMNDSGEITDPAAHAEWKAKQPKKPEAKAPAAPAAKQPKPKKGTPEG